MKSINKVTSLIICLLLLSCSTWAQHTLQTNLRNTNNVASTGILKGKMFQGAVGRNYMRFRKLPALKDGEVRYDVKQKSEGETIHLRFKADTATVQSFEMRLERDSLFVVHPTKTLKIGRYKVGDNIKIVRCKTGFLFYKNGSLLEAYTLPNNNFIAFGEVFVYKALLSKAGVSFTPY